VRAVRWHRKTSCTASRWPHFAPSEAFVSRGGQRAAVTPARLARAQLSVGVRWSESQVPRDSKAKNRVPNNEVSDSHRVNARSPLATRIKV
jgi:hypothetical protein